MDNISNEIIQLKADVNNLRDAVCNLSDAIKKDVETRTDCMQMCRELRHLRSFRELTHIYKTVFLGSIIITLLLNYLFIWLRL